MGPDEFDRELDLAFRLVQDDALGEAAPVIERLRAARPEHVLPFFLAGALAIKQEKPEAAVAHLEEALRRDPGRSEFHQFLADARRALGEFAAAAGHYEDALALKPGDSQILNNLGLCLQHLGDADGAADRFAQALRRVPDDVRIQTNHASALKTAGRYENALAAFRGAAEANPSFEPAQLGLARLLRDLGRDAEARAILERVSAARGDGTFRATSASWRLPVIAASLDEMRARRAEYEAAVGALHGVTAQIAEDDLTSAGTNFQAIYQGVDDRPCQEAIADYYLRNCPSLGHEAPHLGEAPRGAIRLGFVSANFRNHTVGKLFRGLIAKMDRRRFRVEVFAMDQPRDEIGRFIAGNCDAFTVLPGNLAQARETIARTRPHILFYADIGMDAFTYFLAFSRLANVQCVGWGHGVTTGIESMDLFISHTHLEDADGAAAQSHYSERLVRISLPPTYLYPTPPPAAADTPDLSFAQGRAIYCVPQTLYKIHPEFDPLLARILKADPEAVAVFIEGLPGWSDALRARWRALDSNMNARIHFLGRLGQQGFLALLQASRVVLDPVHFSGGISSAEALGLGVPIVTWPLTPLLFGRVTHAYYRQIGVTELIADGADEYVELAVRLSRDKEWRERMRARIKAESGKLHHRQEVVDELGDVLAAALGR